MSTEQSNASLIIPVERDLTSSKADTLRLDWKKLFEEAQNLEEVVLDVSKANLIDSQGLNLIIGLYKECTTRGWKFRVTGCSKDVKRMFSLLKLTERLGITD